MLAAFPYLQLKRQVICKNHLIEEIYDIFKTYCFYPVFLFKWFIYILINVLGSNL